MTGPTEAEIVDAYLRAMGRPSADPMDVQHLTGLSVHDMPQPQPPVEHETHSVDLGPPPIMVPVAEQAILQPSHLQLPDGQMVHAVGPPQPVDLHQGVRTNSMTAEQREQELVMGWMRQVGLA